MSTSSRLAPQKESMPQVQPFPYREAAAIHASAAAGADVGLSSLDGRSLEKSSVQSAHAAGAVLHQAEQAARAAGRIEGEELSRAHFNDELQQLRHEISISVDHFAEERKKYYQQVEADLVKLALAVARKILHREAQMDPLVLAGIARVMTAKLESATGIVVRVNPARAAAWREYFSRAENSRQAPVVAEDPALALDSCVLESSLGSTELGIESQLQEIEKGFADLLAKRPL
jgi:flagellar assembly protein FliH